MVEMMIKPDARPLYAQVRDILLQRINSGMWKPGSSLPSENQLASELGVSQGTVRKALDSLADESVVERRQGRGTFVVEHTTAHVLFKFFQIYENSDDRVLPGVEKTHFGIRKATARVARRLSIDEGADVIVIDRVRTNKGVAFMVETVFLPLDLFPGLTQRSELPNTLYDLFQRDFGITISHVEEDLTAVGATKKQAGQLQIPVDTPLIKIDRIAFDIEGSPVEWRVSFFCTNGLKYRAKLK